MDLTNYNGLKGAVGTFLSRNDLADAAGGFIQLAEAQMARRFVSRLGSGMNVPRRLMIRANLSLEQGTEYLSAPADFLGPLQLNLDGNHAGRLGYLDLSTFELRRARNDLIGAPRFYTVVGSELRFLPVAEAVYDLKITYLCRPPALGDSNPTNWILTDYPDAYLYGALTASAPYLKDDGRITVWSTLFVAAVDDICNADPMPSDKATIGTDISLPDRYADPSRLQNC
jgi:hypothetical protein